MSNYYIGDVHGCLEALQRLLQKINFNQKEDKLFFVGDLVNRGIDSLGVLRLVKSLENAIVVLGNHDLHLLAYYYGVIKNRRKPGFEKIIAAEDAEELTSWLRSLPILYVDNKLKYAMVHAGIPPQWSLDQAQQYAGELEAVLRGDNVVSFLENMYGDTPNSWHESMQGYDRLRYITNAFTRMRHCNQQGDLELGNTTVNTNQDGYAPWFQWRDDDFLILFGHWASLNCASTNENCIALDSGCVYGNCLTAYCLETAERISVPVS